MQFFVIKFILIDFNNFILQHHNVIFNLFTN